MILKHQKPKRKLVQKEKEKSKDDLLNDFVYAPECHFFLFFFIVKKMAKFADNAPMTDII